jgi:glycosyltransferase involved in cell wall biosynthesis
MGNAEPFVSVLTPFYNTAAFLPECIESVLGQSFRNFEYLLVDNHSTDSSAAIARDYAQRDPRVRVIRSDRFRDQIPNYNYALRQISSDSRYVKLAQADDLLYPRCLTEFVELAEAHPSVALVSAYDLRGTSVYGSGLSRDQRVLSGTETARLYFLKWLFLFGSQTTVLYRADVVRARVPFYPEGAMHADTEVVFQILKDHDFGFVHQVLSCTRLRDDSISGKLQNLADTALDRLIIVKRFGQQFLEPSEYEQTLRGSLAWYYDELGRRWLAERMRKTNDEFWAYHRKGLATIGETIHRGAVVRAAGRILVRSAVNPGQLFRRLSEAPSTPPPR